MWTHCKKAPFHSQLRSFSLCFFSLRALRLTSQQLRKLSHLSVCQICTFTWVTRLHHCRWEPKPINTRVYCRVINTGSQLLQMLVVRTWDGRFVPSNTFWTFFIYPAVKVVILSRVVDCLSRVQSFAENMFLLSYKRHKVDMLTCLKNFYPG